MSQEDIATASVVGTFIAVVCTALLVWLGVRFVNSRKKPSRKFWIVLALVVVVAYPLSYGPALWLQDMPGWLGYVTGTSNQVIYKPLNWLVGTSETLSAIFDWYVRLWVTPGPHYIPPK